MLVFLGLDWAERHHDLCVMDATGQVLGRKRVPDGLEGVAQLHALLAECSGGEEGEVICGTETDRGLMVRTLLASGYQVYAINPKAVDRYRDRHRVGGAKSDSADAKVLADLVRTDRHNHRPVVPDSELAEALQVLSRTHKQLIWSRQQEANRLRALLREFYPGALGAFGDLSSRDALAVLGAAPTPAQGRALTEAQVAELLRAAGRRRYLQARAAQYVAALRAPQLEAPPTLTAAYGATVIALVGALRALVAGIEELGATLVRHFERHPDAEIIDSQPGLDVVLGARVLGELGDAPGRYANAKARKNAAGTSPITKQSGTKKVVLRRLARNEYLADACGRWAFSALRASPGALAYYQALRKKGEGHNQALRRLANRLVGILHGCLKTPTHYSEEKAWPEYYARQETRAA